MKNAGLKQKKVLAAVLAGVMSVGFWGSAAYAAEKGAVKMQSAEVKVDRQIKAEKLQLTQEWDKVFPKSDKPLTRHLPGKAVVSQDLWLRRISIRKIFLQLWISCPRRIM